MMIRLWVVAMVTLLCVGCLGQEQVMTEANRIADITYESEGSVTRFYDSGNPHTIEVLGRLSRDPTVQIELERFGAMGYALSPENSFVTEGDIGDGRHVEVTVLSLDGAPAGGRDAIYLFYLGKKRHLILPMELKLEEPDQPVGFAGGSNDAWLTALAPSGAHSGSREGPAHAWGWRRWGKCVAEKIVGGGAGCALGCRFAAVAYLKCLAVCGGIRTLAGVLECTIQEL